MGVGLGNGVGFGDGVGDTVGEGVGVGVGRGAGTMGPEALSMDCSGELTLDPHPTAPKVNTKTSHINRCFITIYKANNAPKYKLISLNFLEIKCLEFRQ